MPSFVLDALLDEDTSEELTRRLRDRGHDVERVVEIQELGDGVDDAAVHSYAERHDRVIVTHDERFFNRCMNSEGRSDCSGSLTSRRMPPTIRRQ